MDDKIIDNYISQLEQENKFLKETIKEKSRPFINFESFVNIWTSFLENSAKVLTSFFDSEGALWAFSIVSLVGIMSTSIITYHVWPNEPIRITAPASRLTNNFHIMGKGSVKDPCYYLVQEKENGSTVIVSPCMREQDKALKLRDNLMNPKAEKEKKKK